jgi:CRT-like, chloroquine-resistance transporter-like
MLFSILLLKPVTDTWKKHLKTFYTPFQYVGAVIVLFGLVISVLPSLTGSSGSAGPPLWDMVFALATIPTALSGVYKEIAFRKAGDMDVFWLNGWVSLFQFLIGLLYAPLAALAQGLPIKEIPQNLWDGLRCVLLGMNFISPACEPINNTTLPSSCNVTVPPYPFCNVTDGSGSGSATDFFGDTLQLAPMQYDTAGSLMLDPFDPMNPMMSAELPAALDLFGFTAFSVLPTEEVFLAAMKTCTTKNADTQLYDCSGGCESECSIDLTCGTVVDGMSTQCCDSCNGRYPQVSPVSALLANLMYMSCNIAYNIFLLMVIKYGSAALMYVASTIVLPLGSLAFTVTAFMGLHRGTFDVYNGTGLGLVLFGLIIYRFVGGKKKRKGDNHVGAEIIDGTPGTMTLIGQATAEEVPIRPRDIQTSRGTYYSRLGLRHVPPRAMGDSGDSLASSSSTERVDSGSLSILNSDEEDSEAEMAIIAESL